jgi:hypothetical protein
MDGLYTVLVVMQVELEQTRLVLLPYSLGKSEEKIYTGCAWQHVLGLFASCCTSSNVVVGTNLCERGLLCGTGRVLEKRAHSRCTEPGW